MMGYGYGMGAGGWIAMTVFWVALITLIIWILSRGLATASGWGADIRPRRGGVRDGAADSAEDILERRFAAGELDEHTYRSMLATLRSSRATQNEPR